MPHLHVRRGWHRWDDLIGPWPVGGVAVTAVACPHPEVGFFWGEPGEGTLDWRGRCPACRALVVLRDVDLATTRPVYGPRVTQVPDGDDEGAARDDPATHLPVRPGPQGAGQDERARPARPATGDGDDVHAGADPAVRVGAVAAGQGGAVAPAPAEAAGGGAGPGVRGGHLPPGRAEAEPGGLPGGPAGRGQPAEEPAGRPA